MMKTKEMMVDFIHYNCCLKGRAIAKTRLNELTKEELEKIIDSNETLKDAFENYIKKGLDQTKIATAEHINAPITSERSVEEMRNELSSLVDQVIEDPTAILPMMELKAFLRNLPYGTLSYEVLMQMAEKIMDSNLGLALVLTKYATRQDTYLQRKEPKKKEGGGENA